MKTEQLLFWLAVFGNLILLYYTIKTGFLAARLIGKGDRTGALRSTLVASALVGLTALFPWTLVAGEREIGKVALVICILTPFVVSMTKLWPSVKGRIPQAPMLAADVAIVGIVVGFAISGDWGWFWAAGIVMAVAWIVARKMAPRGPMNDSRDVERERLHDPLGAKSIHPSADISDPNDPSWGLGR